jgi:hypothetical protein
MRLKRCPLTHADITHFIENGNSFSYITSKFQRRFSFTFCKNCYDKIDFHHDYIIVGLILNNKIPNIEGKVIHWDEQEDINSLSIRSLLEIANYPRTPKEKFDLLFARLYDRFELKEFMSDEAGNDGLFLASSYLLQSEFDIYFDAIVSEGYIQKSERYIAKYAGNQTLYRISYKGMNYFEKQRDDGFTSKNCFIAMSFQPETAIIRSAIKQAVIKTGFHPILVDEQHVSSERTINDEIIASLKKCKFCIADFSYHKNGVYFESGFALGQGKQVIYTCEKEQFANAHFDIKPLQQIIYRTPDELEQKLISKIEAWIK